MTRTSLSDALNEQNRDIVFTKSPDQRLANGNKFGEHQVAFGGWIMIQAVYAAFEHLNKNTHLHKGTLEPLLSDGTDFKISQFKFIAPALVGVPSQFFARIIEEGQHGGTRMHIEGVRQDGKSIVVTEIELGDIVRAYNQEDLHRLAEVMAYMDKVPGYTVNQAHADMEKEVLVTSGIEKMTIYDVKGYQRIKEGDDVTGTMQEAMWDMKFDTGGVYFVKKPSLINRHSMHVETFCWQENTVHAEGVFKFTNVLRSDMKTRKDITKGLSSFVSPPTVEQE